MKPLTHFLPSGGSGYGYSYWSTWRKCCRRASLKGEPDPTRAQSYATASALTTGSILHALMEIYYARGRNRPFDVTRVKYTQDSGDATVNEDSRIEAERLFKAYRPRFPADEMGKILHIEKLAGPSKKTAEAVGLSPCQFAIKPDLVISLNALQAKRMLKTRGIRIKPGRYIVDHKTDKVHWKHLEIRYRNDLRFIAYQEAWNAEYPNCKVDGLIINSLVKTKNVEFVTVFIPPPSKMEVRVLKRYMRNARLNREELSDEPNPEHCLDYNEPCPFFMNGECDRS